MRAFVLICAILSQTGLMAQAHDSVDADLTSVNNLAGSYTFDSSSDAGCSNSPSEVVTIKSEADWLQIQSNSEIIDHLFQNVNKPAQKDSGGDFCTAYDTTYVRWDGTTLLDHFHRWECLIYNSMEFTLEVASPGKLTYKGYLEDSSALYGKGKHVTCSLSKVPASPN